MAKMENLFPEFYLKELTSSDLKTNNLIVLDSNILLDVLRLPSAVSKKYMEAIEKSKNSIFIPYIVGLEFNFNKKETKIRTKQDLEKYEERISESIEKLKDKILDLNFLRHKNKKKEISQKLTDEIENYFPKLDTFIKDEVYPVIHEEYSDDLDIRTRELVNLLGESIADILTQEWIDKVQEEGKARYIASIPPGYNDEKSKVSKGIPDKRQYSGLEYETQYGDYIEWEEILHKVSKDGMNYGDKVIWVTNDGDSNTKNDIYYRYGHEKIGPHIYLLNELTTLRYGYDIINSNKKRATCPEEATNKQLYIINGFRFMELANELTKEEAEYFKTEPIDIVKETVELSDSDIYNDYVVKVDDRTIINKKIAKLQEQNRKRRLAIERLNKKQARSGELSSEQSKALESNKRNLQRAELLIKSLEDTLQLLN
ncbi:hypothetical protein HMPREF1125_1774 [Streptococcus oralis SK304]|uniref:PIN like domain-containing protein n=1 Tax=Streptococcus oralis SK304 TaxID=1161421 RepID=J4TGH2_STROR|nr:PIN-like domain-containing protein [Streptococcus oralis]EJP22229.1 hypothetical protein HMPREF1125_1774 [Streptococcus oralis SK304]